MKNVYFGNFEKWEDVVLEFTGSKYAREDEKKKVLENYPEPQKVIYANYDTHSYDYEGYACVIWKDKRKYFLLLGSHCSCYGLEESGFDPEVFSSKKLFLEYINKTNYIPGLYMNKEDLIEMIK